MANETVNVSQLYETGNKKFFAATLNPDGTFGEKQYHQGLMEVSIAQVLKAKSMQIMMTSFVK